MKMKIILERYAVDENQSTGVFKVVDENGWVVFICPSIERGDRDNKRNVSNVPAGIYNLTFEYSPKFKIKLWELKGVPKRQECKIHAANYWHQLNGCISLGSYLTKLDNDKYKDLAASRRALKDFHRVMRGLEFTTIEIIDPIK